jgi:hypothetical protein
VYIDLAGAEKMFLTGYVSTPVASPNPISRFDLKERSFIDIGDRNGSSTRYQQHLLVCCVVYIICYDRQALYPVERTLLSGASSSQQQHSIALHSHTHTHTHTHIYIYIYINVAEPNKLDTRVSHETLIADDTAAASTIAGLHSRFSTLALPPPLPHCLAAAGAAATTSLRSETSLDTFWRRRWCVVQWRNGCVRAMRQVA